MATYEPKNDFTPTTMKQTTQPPKEKVYNIGDEVVLNEIAYLVADVVTIEALGNQLMYKEASGVFYIVFLAVENRDTKPKDYFNPSLYITDDRSREYSEDREASMYLKMMGYDYFMLEQLQPNLPKKGAVVFDVPTTATGLKLKIKEGLISPKIAMVKLT